MQGGLTSTPQCPKMFRDFKKLTTFFSHAAFFFYFKLIFEIDCTGHFSKQEPRVQDY